MASVGGAERAGGSTHQSLARGSSLETDALNGVIVRLGARLGVPTPWRARVCQVMSQAVAEGRPAGATPLTALTSPPPGQRGPVLTLLPRPSSARAPPWARRSRPRTGA